MIRNYLDQKINQHNLDVVIICSEYNRLWFTNVQSSAGILFLTKISADFFVDSRYIILAKSDTQNANVHLWTQKSLLKFIKEKQKQYHNIGFEADYLTILQLQKFKKYFPKAKFIPLNSQKFRKSKSKSEIKKIQLSAWVALKSFEQLKPEIKAGKTEKALADKLEYLLKQNGAQKPSFDTIVASGVNGAKPHARPTDKKLQNGELVTFDFGAFYQGYASDITRTIKLGKVTDSKLNQIFKIVHQAQQLGIKAVKPGMSCSKIDKICRNYITKMGYGKNFSHATGHGLGIEIHELPIVANDNKQILEVGDVITIEPGIYIEGLGGVRFEDDVLVTKTGYQVLSKID